MDTCVMHVHPECQQEAVCAHSLLRLCASQQVALALQGGQRGPHRLAFLSSV